MGQKHAWKIMKRVEGGNYDVVLQTDDTETLLAAVRELMEKHPPKAEIDWDWYDFEVLNQSMGSLYKLNEISELAKVFERKPKQVSQSESRVQIGGKEYGFVSEADVRKYVEVVYRSYRTRGDGQTGVLGDGLSQMFYKATDAVLEMLARHPILFVEAQLDEVVSAAEGAELFGPLRGVGQIDAFGLGA